MSSEENIETTNEFDDFSIDEDMPPTAEAQGVPGGTENMIDSGGSGTVYDWNTAPEKVRAPPRVDMDNSEVTIEKADIVLPPKDREWLKSRDGKTEYKYCTFTLYYSKDAQQEFYSGVRVFKRDVNGEVKYSHPSMMRDRKNQASKLLGVYADYKKKDINEVSLKEFMAFLNSKPKARIKVDVVKNPQTNEEIRKNMVSEFIEG